MASATMEETIHGEASAIIELCGDEGQCFSLEDLLAGIKQKAEWIIEALEKGDPE